LGKILNCNSHQSLEKMEVFARGREQCLAEPRNIPLRNRTI
jgi:hypothetical protein